MARPLRIEYPGATYHVMARGNQGRAIFKDDQDRRRWVETLAEACGKTGWRIHAYVLMHNHYHVLAETPEGNLVAGMKWLQGTYTQRYNGRHQCCGHLFQGRYKAVPVEAENAGYLETVSTYIHLNPARAGPFGTMNHGTAFLAPSKPATSGKGFFVGLVPPILGCEWQEKH